MDRKHLNTKLTDRSHGASNGIWNVVELQIKKYLFSPTAYFFNQARSFMREYFEADFEESHMARELVYYAKCRGAIRNIQCYD
jgi:hypothetical protein